MSKRERTMDLQSYVSLQEGKPNTWSYSPIHPQPFGLLSLCGPQIWHPRRSCEACRNYSRSVNVCVTSARRFLEPKTVVRGCPFVLQFLGDPQSMAVLCDILLGISMRIVISQRILGVCRVPMGALLLDPYRHEIRAEIITFTGEILRRTGCVWK